MDVMAPDLGTDEQTMAWIMDTYSMKVGYACPEVVTGKPVELGGCIGRREATGRGVTYCILEAMKELNLRPGETTAVVQGFGNVGSVACHELAPARRQDPRRRRSLRRHPQPEGHRHRRPDATRRPTGKLLKDFPGAEPIAPPELLTTPCTVLVPAALERVIHRDNASEIALPHSGRGRQWPDHAGGRRHPQRQRHLHHPRRAVQRRRRDGVVLRVGAGHSAIFVERGGGQSAACSELMLRAFHQVRNLARERKLTMRTAALSLGVQKIAKEKMRRGLYP